MDNVIDISDRFNIQNKKLEIFNNVAKKKDLRKRISSYEVHYQDLLINFDNIYGKLQKGLWSNRSDNQFVNGFDAITSSDNDEQKYINELEFISLYDLLKDDLFKIKEEYISVLLYTYTLFEKVSKTEYKKLIECLSNEQIISKLDEKTTDGERETEIFDYLECIMNGINPTAEVLFVDENENQSNTLNDGILTIDKIYNFYIEQAIFLKSYDIINEDVLSDISKILLIKKYSNKNQIKFIELSKIVKEISPNLLQNIENIISLTNIFLSFDKEIDNISLDTLEKMLIDKIMPKKNIDEIKQAHERKM